MCDQLISGQAATPSAVLQHVCSHFTVCPRRLARAGPELEDGKHLLDGRYDVSHRGRRPVKAGFHRVGRRIQSAWSHGHKKSFPGDSDFNL